MRIHQSISLLLMVLPAALAAQFVSGNVTDRSTGRPIPYPAVQLLDESGAPVTRVSGSGSGRFSVMLLPGKPYSVIIAAIGYRPVRVGPFAIGDTILAMQDIRMEPMVVPLADVVTTSDAGRCQPDRAAAARMAPVFDAASNAVDVMQSSLESDDGKYVVRTINATIYLLKGGGEHVEADTLHRHWLSWPVGTAGGDTLVRLGFGFQSGRTSRGPNEWRFYGPGPETIFSEWFVASHCFAAAIDRTDSTTFLVVSFEPAEKSRKIDISGKLVLDTATMALRRIEFRHVNLPDQFPAGSSGGMVEFDQRGDGVWLPMRWVMYAPIVTSGQLVTMRTTGSLPPGVTLDPAILRRIQGEPRAIGRKEMRGEVVGSP